MTTDQIKYLKETYIPGVTVRLISMYREPQMKAGMTGKTTSVDDIGQIHVAWDNGSSLALNCEVDQFIAFVGPTPQEYLRKQLRFADHNNIWFMEADENHAIITVDIERLISEAEKYMEKVTGISKDLAVSTCIPYKTETLLDVFLANHVLTDDDMQQLRKKTAYKANESEAGRCPKCGNDNLIYEAEKLVEQFVEHPWECNVCGAAGKEYGAIVFDGHDLDRLPDKSYSLRGKED